MSNKKTTNNIFFLIAVYNFHYFILILFSVLQNEYNFIIHHNSPSYTKSGCVCYISDQMNDRY